jgi:hypothetical protein
MSLGKPFRLPTKVVGAPKRALNASIFSFFNSISRRIHSLLLRDKIAVKKSHKLKQWWSYELQRNWAGSRARNMDWKTDHLHGHQTDNVLVITLASFADLSCVSSSSSTIRSSPALVMPSGRQIRAVFGT